MKNLFKTLSILCLLILLVSCGKSDDNKSGGVFTAADGISDGRELQVIYADNDKFFQYIVLNSVSKNGDVVNAWLISNFQGSQLQQFKEKFNASSAKYLYQYNCIDKTLRMVRSQAYSGSMASGILLDDSPANSDASKWEAAGTGNVGQETLGIVCKLAQSKELSSEAHSPASPPPVAITNPSFVSQTSDLNLKCKFDRSTSNVNATPEVILTIRAKENKVFWSTNEVQNLIQDSKTETFSGTLNNGDKGDVTFTGTNVKDSGINVLINNLKTTAKLSYFCPGVPATENATGSRTQSNQTPAQSTGQTVSAVTPAPVIKNDKSSIMECDELAGSPMDPQKKSAGISYDKINAVTAVNACQQAVKIESTNSRLWFQLGRALEKGNSIDDAIAAYQKAAQLGSASAYNNIGELYRQGKGFPKNKERAAEFFKKSADLGSTEGRDNLASLSKSK